jgi:hypothetical protein
LRVSCWRESAWSVTAALAVALVSVAVPFSTAAQQATEVEKIAVTGEAGPDGGELVISATLKPPGGVEEKLIYATRVEHTMSVQREQLNHLLALKVDVIQGDPEELVFPLAGEGDVREVEAEGLASWSVRRGGDGAWALVLHLVGRESKEALKQFRAQVRAVTGYSGDDLPRGLVPLAIQPADPALFNGVVRIESVPGLQAHVRRTHGLSPMEADFAPEALRGPVDENAMEPLFFQFHAQGYELAMDVTEADPEARQVVLRDFALRGDLSDERAGFVLTATAQVRNPKGGTVVLLSGDHALTSLNRIEGGRPTLRNGALVIEFEKDGSYPLELAFDATVSKAEGWNRVGFRVAPAILQPIILRGLQSDTEFRFANAARPELEGDVFRSFLPPTGEVALEWTQAKPESEGRLFFAVEAFGQVTISPGLLRQTDLLEFRVMQGELEELTLVLEGEGEVTRVQGAPVLAWSIAPGDEAGQRRLSVKFNQPQKEAFALQVQTQTTLGTFPLAADTMKVVPEGATRFGGYVRIVNDGAVRLEVLESRGLSQISPEQLPQTPATHSVLPPNAGQVFAYRFSGSDFDLRVQADNIIPELSVSEVLSYHLGDTELVIEGEFELDIREAPIRELTLRVPARFVVAALSASNLADHTLAPGDNPDEAALRLVYSQPVSGRQVLQLRLERNVSLDEETWVLPRVEVLKTKATRGQVGISSAAGFRLTPESTGGLTEIATAFFPKKLENIQAAFRLSDPNWTAGLRIERLPQSIQADVFHLFSVGEAIAYGSSVMNFVISGAPVQKFRVELSAEYYNVEFTGRDILNYSKVDGGYEVQLHTPVAGDYTLLATYERPFKPQGETLMFVGARPQDAQTEQGYTLVISTYQFQVEPANVSPGLLKVEPGEVPAAYRLFFDAPILAAYRYTARPFTLALALKPLVQAETLQQVVDRAALTTRISEEGQVLTTARYFVKNKGQSNLRVIVPSDSELWQATVDGKSVVPVKDGDASLLSLPQTTDPNTVFEIELQLASKSRNSNRLKLQAPAVMAPVMLTEWDLRPDENRRLVFRGGTLTPTAAVGDTSGFAGINRFLQGNRTMTLMSALVLFLVGALTWRWAADDTSRRWSPRHWMGGLVGLGAVTCGIILLVDLTLNASRIHLSLPNALRFVAPVQESASVLEVEVSNDAAEFGFLWLAWRAWPAVLGGIAGLALLVAGPGPVRRVGLAIGWTGLLWTALRWPNGAAAFLAVLMLFLLLQVVLPALVAVLRVPRKEPDSGGGEGGGGGTEGAAAPAGATAAGIALACLLGGAGDGWAVAQAAQQERQQQQAGSSVVLPTPREHATADSVNQSAKVEEEFVTLQVKVRWRAEDGDMLPLLYPPGVLTGIELPDGLRQFQTATRQGSVQQLIASQAGDYEIPFTYQVRVQSRDGQSGFFVPTQYGLINRLRLEVTELDVDVLSPDAVSVTPVDSEAGRGTRAELVMKPTSNAWVGWKPRSRDTRREKAVFFAECFQLFVPTAGIVEGAHVVQVRPAQGELGEITFTVPEGQTITDVVGEALSFWRFDPDERLLRVSLNPPQARPFSLTIGSQIATTPLPYEQTAGLIVVNQAANQVGMAGVATGPEVQLDDVAVEGLSTINLDDFPASVVRTLAGRINGLVLRRAFRYTESSGKLTVKAAAVEPDVRVVSQQTLSLGEDRVLLAAALNVTVTRAGIFRLSFVLPAGLDVESISGAALSHWTELKSGEERIITLHLKGKTEGAQRFDLALAGPGLQTTAAWSVPRLSLREASKQQGRLVIVPEQGMRLQAGEREGVIPLDPSAAGTRQKSALAFRLLNPDWQLALDIEQVDSWVQVNGFQQVSVQEGQARVLANLDYQIENTGLRSLRVRLPEVAENVRFTGDQLADFLPVEGSVTNATQAWEIRLHRRVIGAHRLGVSYTLRVPDEARELLFAGIVTEEVNVQRGFLAMQAGGRVQLRIATVPDSLRPAEWEAVPASLRQDLTTTSVSHVFRLVDPGFRLSVQILRHETTPVLPARVQNVQLTSVISDAGVMLTRGQVELTPGDKRLLRLRLPKDAEFWFAFVNEGGVWLWREGGDVLIPLQQATVVQGNTRVDFYYTTKAGRTSTRKLDLTLHGPQLDLPLQQIAWRVYLDPKWELTDWDGTLQLAEEPSQVQTLQGGWSSYLESERQLQQRQTEVARQNFEFGNTLILKGDVQNARRYLNNAYQLSQADLAFNEDARVQLRNLKTEQALVGLNVNRGLAAQQPAQQAEIQQILDNDANYTREQAKALNQSLSSEDQLALGRLAEKLVAQQDAAVANPTAIRASVPEQGRMLAFTRSLQVDTMSDLRIELEARAVREGSLGGRFLLVCVVLLGSVIFSLLPRRKAS